MSPSVINPAAELTLGSLTMAGPLFWDAEAHILVLEDLAGGDPADYGQEVISVNLTAYPHVPLLPEGCIYVKDWSEHQGMADALVESKIAEHVPDEETGSEKTSVTVGPFNSTAYLMRVLIPEVPTT